jgi:5-formyltetrahydrofolate cyclo-ligase
MRSAVSLIAMSLLSEQKDLYRAEAKRHRERMDIRNEDPEAAAEIFLKAYPHQDNHIIAAYWPKGRELDTTPLLHYLLERGSRVALPIMRAGGDKVLDFYPWDESIPLEKGAYDIMQPQIAEGVNGADKDAERFVLPDIVIVPLLAFDRRGQRLGYGGGYYDATLAALRAEKQIVAVGYAYAQQAVLFNLPFDALDQRLDFVVTPSGMHDFTAL